jgi:hypothetical protein
MSKQLIAHGLFALMAITIVTALLSINEQRHMPLPGMYFTCSRDQVDANIHNQPKGFEPMLVNHCVLHSGGAYE